MCIRDRCLTGCLIGWIGNQEPLKPWKESNFHNPIEGKLFISGYIWTSLRMSACERQAGRDYFLWRSLKFFKWTDLFLSSAYCNNLCVGLCFVAFLIEINVFTRFAVYFILKQYCWSQIVTRSYLLPLPPIYYAISHTSVAYHIGLYFNFHN